MLLERDRELDRLDGVLTAIGSTGGMVVLLRGEAGIGKTRLVDEFVRLGGDAIELLFGTYPPGGVATGAGALSAAFREYLEFLDSFRYPLAGEFAIRRDVINDLRIPSDWGLEIGVLSEMHRNYANNRICQVDIADNYDHKHQPLSETDPDAGLAKMSIDISKALFRKLATQGVVFNRGVFRTVKATYYRIALDFIETYYNDAVMNGLEFDRHQEEKAVEMFSQNIMKAGKQFLAENAKKEGVVMMESGLQYKVIKSGEGPRRPEDIPSRS